MKLVLSLIGVLACSTVHGIDLRDPCDVYGWAAFYVQDERMAKRGQAYLDKAIQDLRNQRVEVGPTHPRYDLLNPTAMRMIIAYTYSFSQDIYPFEVRRRLWNDCAKDMRKKLQ